MTRGRSVSDPDSGQLPLPGEPPPAIEGLDAGWAFEERAWSEGHVAVAGIDEVGRGALAGPVLASAVIFPPGTRLEGLRDSKLLSSARREVLALFAKRPVPAAGEHAGKHHVWIIWGDFLNRRMSP